MLFQLSEIEYSIIDSLADGPEPLSLLIRELRESRHPWDVPTVVPALSGLMEKQVVRCMRVPGRAAFMTPSREVLLAQTATLPGNPDQEYWFELTESGQTIWDQWRQTRP